jgi:hypothetical protein
MTGLLTRGASGRSLAAELARLAILRERIRAAKVPRARAGPSLVLATWNIRELGKSPRRRESPRFIAEVLRAFDLTCIIELREDLADMGGVLRHLVDDPRRVAQRGEGPRGCRARRGTGRRGTRANGAPPSQATESRTRGPARAWRDPHSELQRRAAIKTAWLT